MMDGMETAQSDWMKVREVAGELGVGRKTVNDLIRTGRLPATNFGERLTRVHRGDLERYAREHKLMPVAPTRAEKGAVEPQRMAS